MHPSPTGLRLPVNPNGHVVQFLTTCHNPYVMSVINEAALFPSTHWSLVQRARGDDGDVAKQAVDTLFATYWKPICGYIRYLGQSQQDAEDLTQEFSRQLMVRRNLFQEVRKNAGNCALTFALRSNAWWSRPSARRTR